MGPRGLSVLERVCANARHTPASAPVTVHTVDDHAPGAGAVWRTEQPRLLLMNTVAGQVSVFTDDTVAMDGPLEPGPSLYAWASALTGTAPEIGLDAGLLAESRALGPDTYPTRALCGAYYRWAYRRITAGAPAGVTVVAHRARAVALDEHGGHGGGQRVTLGDGTVLDGLGAVVLALGHLPLEPTAQESEFAAFAVGHGLIYVPPGNPADLDLSVLPAGEPVVLRGLGLNFFDHMALLTEGRGGRYQRTGGRLVYEASGAEPLLYAGSRGGLPYHARGENQKGPYGRHEPLLLTAEYAVKLRAQHSEGAAGVDFRAELWPLIAREVEITYYSRILAGRERPTETERFRVDYIASAADEAERAAVLERHGIPPEDRWDWERTARPHAARAFTGPDDFRAWVIGHLREDLAEARRGNLDSPLKSALDVLRDLRNEIRLAIDHGGVAGESYAADVDGWYTPLNAALSIGPPARRVEELIALIEARVVHIMGPGLRVAADAEKGSFTAEAAGVPGSRVAVRALVEARLPAVDLRRSAEPLLRQLLADGMCRPYRMAGVRTSYEAGGIDITGRPYHLVDAEGRSHPRRFVFGVPTESVHWVTAAGIRPGVGSVTLTDADAIARTALSLPPASGEATDPGTSLA
ncbi:FAD/NAD(P)-binding protein [Streptomyces sp. UNOC14_S4]|uniref:FAD/NAD(P)-binding protein n=1 Tax=Streptomyces sp. UNOC14_S4 TaxID=2872340 RepID=UPI001E604320|nr:FAD/NAD(P)-binding protein [Streptomyces sp. UNOC14_S4]